jgi:L-fucono-1,5-lactonase
VTAGETSDDAVVVDAHHHLWDPSHGYGWLDAPELAPIRRTFTPDDLRAAIAGTGVGHTVLVEGGREHADEVPEHLAAAAATPEIAGVVAWADLTDPALADTIDRYRALPGAAKLVGLRDQVQGRVEPGFLARGDVRANLAVIGAAGLAFDLVVKVRQLPDAAAAARALPGVRFVLDHLGKPRIAAGAEGLAEWRAAVAPLAACPNATAKLSGLVSEADWVRWTVEDLRPFVTAAVELFGPDRLMFGSDWPVCTTVTSYGRVLSALREALPALSDVERAAVFGGTAVRTYRLEI